MDLKNLQSTITVQSSQLIINFVEKNIGLAFLPEQQVRASADMNLVRILKPVDYEFTYAMNIFYHKDKLLTKPMEALFQTVNSYTNIKGSTDVSMDP